MPWAVFIEAGIEGQLVDLLVKLPRTRWAERTGYGSTLLHFACDGPNVAALVALVQSGLVDVDARDQGQQTPAHSAAVRVQSRMLEVLCAAGADVRARTKSGMSPLAIALVNADRDGGKAARVLVANGVRLSAVPEAYPDDITPELVAFERGVLRCRAAVVAMLRVKRASEQLAHWDKFLLVEVALCIWATRYDKEWQ